jgi:ATP-binding cassette subfamily B protein
MNNGEIIEQGNHNYLMAQKGTYFELYEKQLLEEEENA